MTIIENSISYSGKNAKSDCESGDASAMPKVKRDCCCLTIHITQSVVSTPRANFFISCFEGTLFAIVLSAAITTVLALLLPMRPSNLILWKTTRSCDEVRSALRYQLENWTETFPAYTNCSSYQVFSTEPHALWLWHRAEWKSAAYEADISLLSTPRPNNTCYVLARCVSHGSEWPLDTGASLCFLAADSSFLGSLASQFTDDPFCTQFSSVGLKSTVCQDESENMKLAQSLLDERDWLRSVDRAATS